MKLFKFPFLAIVLLLCLLLYNTKFALCQDKHFVGAQVFIEPGQKTEKIESLFKTMSDNGMKFCRIRMFESYMRKADSTWDFSLFDVPFTLAVKYDIKVLATFFPYTEKTDIGGWKFPKDQEQLASFARYIKALTTHFNKYESLYAWVLINEPGGGLKDTPFSREMRQQWNENNKNIDYLPNGYPSLMDFKSEQFKMYMNFWMLNWIAKEVRKYDKEIHLHVNSHAIFDNLAEYDFRKWRTFLNSLGGSAHPSWHFTNFERKDYALAMSANCEIIRSGAGDIPWLMTELQGGNNTFSGVAPMCPTSQEIIQWLWLVLAANGEGSIFWSLNARATGKESGEWALLDFQGNATDRINAIKKFTETLELNPDLTNAKRIEQNVSIVYTKESLWTEQLLGAGSSGRKFIMKNLMGYFKVLTEMGANPSINAIEEFDFQKGSFKGHIMILSHQLAISSNHNNLLNSYVQKGGKLIIDGLSGFYDENLHNHLLTGFPLADTFGGNIKEFKYSDEPFAIEFKKGNMIYGYNWMGTLVADYKKDIIADKNGSPIALRHKHGLGEVLWLPSLLGVAAWDANHGFFAEFLKKEISEIKKSTWTDSYQDRVIIKLMATSNRQLAILINKNETVRKVSIPAGLNGQCKIIFKDGRAQLTSENLTLHPEETVVLAW